MQIKQSLKLNYNNVFEKKITGDDAKKTKTLTVIQVLTKYFTFYKIRYKSLRKRK